MRLCGATLLGAYESMPISQRDLGIKRHLAVYLNPIVADADPRRGRQDMPQSPRGPVPAAAAARAAQAAPKVESVSPVSGATRGWGTTTPAASLPKSDFPSLPKPNPITERWRLLFP